MTDSAPATSESGPGGASGANPRGQPLAGIRVLDFSTLVPGPLATLLLAEAGAEVIKVERPGGDELRRYPDPAAAAVFALLNRGKRSLELDLKDASVIPALRRLIETCDVLVEQFRPGVMARFGLSYDDLRAAVPRLIYCSITGYGQSGPDAGRAAHDLNYLADSGILDLVRDDGGAPVLPHALIADIAGGAYPAFANILLALRQRDRTGRGARIDIAMADNVYPLLFWSLAAHWSGTGSRASTLFTGGSPRYRVYATQDGRHLAVAALEDRFWRELCDRVGLDRNLWDDQRDPTATGAALAARISSRPLSHWIETLNGLDVCCAAVRELAEALDDPRVRSKPLCPGEVRTEDDRALPALPVIVDNQHLKGGVRSSPALGEANREFGFEQRNGKPGDRKPV